MVMAGALWNISKDSCFCCIGWCWCCWDWFAPNENEFRFAGGDPSLIPDQDAMAAVVEETYYNILSSVSSKKLPNG